MRKVHLKVVLDVFVHADEDVNVADYVEDVITKINIDSYSTESIEMLDWTVEKVEITDSR